MLEDDDRPRPKPRHLAIGQSLEGVSVADLEAQIAALRSEIGRLEAEIARRSDHRAAAEALFRKPPPAEDR